MYYTIIIFGPSGIRKYRNINKNSLKNISRILRPGDKYYNLYEKRTKRFIKRVNL